MISNRRPRSPPDLYRSCLKPAYIEGTPPTGKVVRRRDLDVAPAIRSEPQSKTSLLQFGRDHVRGAATMGSEIKCLCPGSSRLRCSGSAGKFRYFEPAGLSQAIAVRSHVEQISEPRAAPRRIDRLAGVVLRRRESPPRCASRATWSPSGHRALTHLSLGRTVMGRSRLSPTPDVCVALPARAPALLPFTGARPRSPDQDRSTAGGWSQNDAIRPAERHEFADNAGLLRSSWSHSELVRSTRRSASVQSRLELHLCQAPRSRRADAIRGWCQQFNPRYEGACRTERRTTPD